MLLITLYICVYINVDITRRNTKYYLILSTYQLKTSKILNPYYYEASILQRAKYNSSHEFHLNYS